VVVATDKTRFAVSDASRAIQSMLLAAWADGVGSNWVGFGGLEQVKDLLGLPAGLEVLAILPFGYPARPVGGARSSARRCARWLTSSDTDGPSSKGAPGSVDAEVVDTADLAAASRGGESVLARRQRRARPDP
jgi:hypothetical protein